MKKAIPRRRAPSEALSLGDLCRFCAVEEEWVIELVQEGILQPRGTSVDTWEFQGKSIVRAKKAQRLRRDTGMNTEGLALVLNLLDERETILRRLARADTV